MTVMTVAQLVAALQAQENQNMAVAIEMEDQTRLGIEITIDEEQGYTVVKGGLIGPGT